MSREQYNEFTTLFVAHRLDPSLSHFDSCIPSEPHPGRGGKEGDSGELTLGSCPGVIGKAEGIRRERLCDIFQVAHRWRSSFCGDVWRALVACGIGLGYGEAVLCAI